ncbi:uncharacterized protein LOC110837099 [Zootermopsis nevadensis]|uniref:Uncharacterized protein n=1 Tax=Zootermopsis nevadensis TaxID=136037 RepID=A0A067R1H6_ZOONE|nr:uncharacterized protein LOC110837099 [Zootermopsis nevadensis]KDR11438.1 hypothetical protein L798_13444 [Zootermopsis nevadensis]
MSSGIVGAKQNREDKSNQLEVTLCYSPRNSEEGETEELTLGVTKLRWSVESALEYERKNALLYVKLNVLDGGRTIKACKTKPFAPSISVPLSADKNNSSLTVHLPSNREHLTCQLSLCTKPSLGKKIVFGRVVLAPGSEHWDKTFQMPATTITQWHSIR